MHLADRALTQRVAKVGGALVPQLVPVDQNFGHRGTDGYGRSQHCRTLWTEVIAAQIELRTEIGANTGVMGREDESFG